jgi:hypothetical protein
MLSTSVNTTKIKTRRKDETNSYNKSKSFTTFTITTRRTKLMRMLAMMQNAVQVYHNVRDNAVKCQWGVTKKIEVEEANAKNRMRKPVDTGTKPISLTKCLCTVNVYTVINLWIPSQLK